MAVCKTCGCAIPIGSKTCDMCAAVGAVAPAQQPQVWQAPANAAGPTELASSAASWAALPGAYRRPPPTDVQKAEKSVRGAWRYLGFLAALYIVLGTITVLGYASDLLSLFGWWAIAIGAAFLVCAYFVRKGSLAALAIAIGIYALYTVALFLAGYFAIFRVIIVLLLLRDLGHMNTLREYRKHAQQSPTPDQTRAA
jgi:hypothetical protein